MTDETIAAARLTLGPRPVVAEAQQLIKDHEGLRLKAYLCPAGVCTIGWGHTRTARLGMVITAVEAEALFADDLRLTAAAVTQALRVPVNDYQFAALVSFAFNVGVGNFIQSSLLRLLNRGWYEQVPAQFMRWTRVRGEVMGGLSRRRAAEVRLWNRTL